VYDDLDPLTWSESATIEPLLAGIVAWRAAIGLGDGIENHLPLNLEFAVRLQDVSPASEVQSDDAAIGIDGLPHCWIVRGDRGTANSLFERRKTRPCPTRASPGDRVDEERQVVGDGLDGGVRRLPAVLFVVRCVDVDFGLAD